MAVVPCPSCGSWETTPLDLKRLDWCCNNPTCPSKGVPFKLKNHYALVIYDNKEVTRVDKNTRLDRKD